MTAPRFDHVDPAVADQEWVRRQLLELWVAATNAGGAIGFAGEVADADIAPVLDAALDRWVAGFDDLGILVDDGSTQVLAMGFLVANTAAISRHWRLVARVAVRPDAQRAGLGSALMRGLHGVATGLGLDHLLLTVRDGTGLDSFYERLGYVRCGVHPRALLLSNDDVRDEIYLVAPLDGGGLAASGY